VGERTEIVARFSYYKTEGTNLDVGTFNGQPLGLYFDESGDYEEVGFEVGFRYYISSTGRLKSYVAPVAGARFLDEVLVSFSSSGAGSSILNVPFNEESTVAVFGLDLGVSLDLGRLFFIALDSGLRYQTAPGQFDELEGLTTIDDSDGRWTAPVVLSLGVRF
jgi:hypothetical protein